MRPTGCENHEFKNVVNAKRITTAKFETDRNLYSKNYDSIFLSGLPNKELMLPIEQFDKFDHEGVAPE